MCTNLTRQILSVDLSSLQKAQALLEAGCFVGVPTETVYGLAADATNGKAVARIFEAKGRPQFNPLICHVSSLDMAQAFAQFNDNACALAGAFWPGPLTLVLPLKENSAIHPLVTAGLNTVAVRFPRGPMANLIAAFGKPLAAPSANASGKISPTTAKAVLDSLGDKVDLILDGGACAVGLESTIVKVDGDRLILLRPGSVTLAEIEKVAQMNVSSVQKDATIQAPGMLASHYAPNAIMRLDVSSVMTDEAFLAFGPIDPEVSKNALVIENLSASGDLIEAAANLFSMMSKLDQSGALSIAVAPIPMEGIGIAINDRLARAAAPRELL
ncbi:MAG: L-threonylcarbamoyladenylate synthase [Ahrensia sp.]|nr:L-threonylcarbamoyladenylate synthase [Ahrensia sp.]